MITSVNKMHNHAVQPANFSRVIKRISKCVASGEVKNLIFDLDGVLINSRAANVKSTLEILERHGFSPKYVNGSLEALCSRHSPEFILRALAPELEKKPALLKRMTHELSNIGISNKEFITATPLTDTLEDYRKMGVKMGVATNRKASAMPIIMHLGMDKYFDAVVTSLMAAEKPDPEMIRVALRMMNASPENTRFIGDNNEDWLAGWGAGVKTFRVHWKQE